MKYKLIIFLIFLSFNALADECKNFEDKVMSIPFPENGIVSDGQQPDMMLAYIFSIILITQKIKLFLSEIKIIFQF